MGNRESAAMNLPSVDRSICDSMQISSLQSSSVLRPLDSPQGDKKQYCSHQMQYCLNKELDGSGLNNFASRRPEVVSEWHANSSQCSSDVDSVVPVHLADLNCSPSVQSVVHSSICIQRNASVVDHTAVTDQVLSSDTGTHPCQTVSMVPLASSSCTLVESETASKTDFKSSDVSLDYQQSSLCIPASVSVATDAVSTRCSNEVTSCSDTALTSIAATTWTCNDVDTMTSVMSVITPVKQTVKVKVSSYQYSPAPEDSEHLNITGCHYKLNQDNGSVLDGIWDGKCLTVTSETSTVASQNTQASNAPSVCSLSTCNVSPACSVSSNIGRIYSTAKRMPECHVKLDKLDMSDLKRMRVDSSCSPIDMKHFYGTTSDGHSHKPRSRMRKNLSDSPVVIHIEDDDDDDDYENNGNSDGKCLDNFPHPSSVVLDLDDDEFIMAESVQLGQYCRHNCSARFQTDKLTISSNTELCHLSISGCDISSVACTQDSNDESQVIIVIEINKRDECLKIELLDFFDIPSDQRIDLQFNKIILTISNHYELGQVQHLVSNLSCAPSDHSDGVDSTLDMECQDVSSTSVYCPLFYTDKSPSPKISIECRAPLHQSTLSERSQQDLKRRGSSTTSGHRQKHVQNKSLARHHVQSSSAILALHAYDDNEKEEDDNEEDSLPSCSIDHDEICVPAHFHSEIVKLFTYPAPPAVGGITVTNEDLFCLNDGEFLNDVVVEFYIKYLYNNRLTASQREKTHIFNTFFYDQLRKENKESSSGLSLQRRRHSQVKRWTKHVDLFSKDFIIVPINDESHWFLAIICFPHLVGCASISSKHCLPTVSDHTTSVTDETKNPCILIFDSLKNGANRWNVAVILREYLQVEWDEKKAKTEGAKIFDKSIMKGATPGCPQQSNSSDCGIYLLHYIERFFTHPLHDFRLPIRYLNDWFPKDEVSKKRREICRLILKLTRELNPSLNYDPRCDGCEIADN